MSDLSNRVLLSPSGLTRLVDRLVAMRLVRREADPADGRVALASLTDQGLRLLKRAARSHLKGVRQHFTGRLSKTQLRNVASALESIAGAHAPH
jgi:DNA-binding MarR family transcriptional regulator